MMNTTMTESGAVRGEERNGCVVYRGIPYAAPPVGSLRWKMPKECEPWSGTRDCTRFGNIAMQTLPTGEMPWDKLYYREFYSYPEYIPPMSEDCLYLNIWTPAESPADKLPVAFWIHGGGFGGGYGSEIEFDGEEYAKRGMILVTINYRCGVFGFLAHPWLTAESERGISGNYGIFDQIAALRWVYRNIASFGGDPGRITVFGQSAGCMSTQVLVSSELTENLISGAILQSGVQTTDRFLTTPTLEAEEKYGERIVKISRAKSLEELRALDAETLIGAKAQFDMELMSGRYKDEFEDGSDRLRIVPNVDGYLLKKTVREVFAEGTMKKIPYIAGCCADDLATTDEDREKGDPGALLRWSREWCGRAEELGNPPAYCYDFEHLLPGENGQMDKPFHSAELWYVFGTLGRCWRAMSEEDYRLSAEILDAWTAFMKTGSPNTGGAETWRPYTKADPFVRKYV